MLTASILEIFISYFTTPKVGKFMLQHSIWGNLVDTPG